MNDFLQSLRNGQAEKPRTPKTRKNHDNSYHHTSAPRFHSYGGYQNTRNQQMKRPQAPQHHQGNHIPTDDNTTSAILAEAIENLNSHIETLAANQNYLVTAQERTADMLERQAIAIERIIDHLNIDTGKKTQPPLEEPALVRKTNSFRKANTVRKNNNVKKASTTKKALKNHHISSYSTAPEPEPAKPIAIEPSPKESKPVKSVIRKRKRIVAKKPIESAREDKKLLGRDKIMGIINTMRAEGATFDQVASHLVSLGQPTFSGRGEWHAQTIHRLCNKK